jgi:hypothetical protein
VPIGPRWASLTRAGLVDALRPKCYLRNVKAHSSSGLGHRPLKAEIRGSNPLCATTRLFKLLPFGTLCRCAGLWLFSARVALPNRACLQRSRDRGLRLLVSREGGSVWTRMDGEPQRDRRAHPFRAFDGDRAAMLLDDHLRAR